MKLTSTDVVVWESVKKKLLIFNERILQVSNNLKTNCTIVLNECNRFIQTDEKGALNIAYKEKQLYFCLHFTIIEVKQIKMPARLFLFLKGGNLHHKI